jgi:CHAT domain-containing protein
LGDKYPSRFGEHTERTLQDCLKQLYTALVEPIAPMLEGDHLIVVPHGVLHQVPFQALWSGDSYLLDRFSISYAPSASLYSVLQGSTGRLHKESLVLGIPDQLAPEISNEVAVVAENLPGARVFLGEDATVERLQSLGSQSQIVHIATHGTFRQDNPMFSSIQLGGSRLTLLDLYDLKLEAELVVLSGCSTGLHRVETGDELMGLTRGLLYAGARSVLVTLWDVGDKSTLAFMKSFYRLLQSKRNRAQALASAMKELRSEYPSPYHWAPFVLIGGYDSAEAPLLSAADLDAS